MKRLFSLACALALAIPLAACGFTGGGLSDPATASAAGAIIDATGAKAPAPLAKPSTADSAIDVGVDAIEITLSALDLGIAAGTITPGSPKALFIADWVDKARNAINAADAARQSLSATDYKTAMQQAAVAFRELNRAF